MAHHKDAIKRIKQNEKLGLSNVKCWKRSLPLKKNLCKQNLHLYMRR